MLRDISMTRRQPHPSSYTSKSKTEGYDRPPERCFLPSSLPPYGNHHYQSYRLVHWGTLHIVVTFSQHFWIFTKIYLLPGCLASVMRERQDWWKVDFVTV